MKIERISDTQVKIILSQTDLEERGIKVNDLSYGSEKTHKLFQEMMRQAHSECDFQSENTPLMVEAMTVSTGHVVVVVTKISDSAEAEEPLTLMPRAKEKFKTQGFIETRETQPGPGHAHTQTLSIFSFASLDEAAEAAARIHTFNGASKLYKHESRYYIALRNDNEPQALASADILLHEYGEKHVSSVISETYLAERGEVIIRADAVGKLMGYIRSACETDVSGVY